MDGYASLGCCPRMMKCFIILINMLLALIGAGICALGVWIYQSEIVEVTGAEYATFAVGLGVFILLLALCGCLSACKHWVCGLIGFAILLFICLVATVVIFSVWDGNIGQSFLASRWAELSSESKEKFQDQFDCCGWDETETWDICPAGVNPEEDYCWNAVKDIVYTERITVAYSALGIVVLETIMLVFTICLCRKVRAVNQSNDVGPIYTY